MVLSRQIDVLCERLLDLAAFYQNSYFLLILLISEFKTIRVIENNFNSAIWWKFIIHSTTREAVQLKASITAAWILISRYDSVTTSNL